MDGQVSRVRCLLSSALYRASIQGGVSMKDISLIITHSITKHYTSGQYTKEYSNQSHFAQVLAQVIKQQGDKTNEKAK